MLAHAWSVLCDKVITDRDTNNLSLDVLEQVYFQVPTEQVRAESQIIAIPYKMQIVSQWYKTDPAQPERQRARIRLVAPGGDELGSQEIDINLATAIRARVQTQVDALPTKGSGVYFFIIEKFTEENWGEVAKLPLQVTVTDVEPPVGLVAGPPSVIPAR